MIVLVTVQKMPTLNAQVKKKILALDLKIIRNRRLTLKMKILLLY